jgi:teichuronic acid exporter
MSLKRVVMHGFGWTAGAKFLSQLITWVITIVVIRLLTPTDYGLMAVAGVFVSFLAMLNELGFGAAIIQREDLDENTLRSLFGWVVIASVGFCILLAACAPLIACFYNEPRLVPLIRILALQFLLMGFTVLPQSLLLRNMEFRNIAIVNFISAIAGSLAMLVFALGGYGVWALVWGGLVIRAVSMIGVNVAKPFLLVPRFTIKGMGKIFSFGGYVTMSRILWYLYSRSDKLIIGKALGKDLLGFYAVGMQIASLPMEKISGIVNQVSFPAFSSVQSEPNLLRRHFLKAVRVMSVFAFPVCWGISGIGSEIVTIFLGAKWSAAALPLQIIALIIPVRMISNIMAPVVLGTGRADVLFKNTLVGLIFMPAALFVGSFWGLFGVSLAWVIVFPLVFYINLSRVVKVLSMNLKEVFESILMPLICGMTMYGCVQLIKITPMLATASVLKMIVVSACGAVIYCLMTLILNRKGLEELRELVRT